MSGEEPVIRTDRIDAVIFDMDGVVTDTAGTHAAAWKRLFDEYLQERARRYDEPFRPFDAGSDYRRYVDGKPRYDGVRSFLESRDIQMPQGEPTDPPERETVCGLGNRKDGYFLAHLSEHGADPYPSTVQLVRALQQRGIHTAIISASRNMTQVLESAGLSDLFEVKVDGVVASELGLRGKPHPAVFLEAARRLGVEPHRAVVVEDAIAGVQAGHRGRFELVIGVDRAGQRDALSDAGAHVVVDDLAEVRIADAGRASRSVRELPSPLEDASRIEQELRGHRLAVFLDYDGTLTPIVDHPSQAILAGPTREAVRTLARVCTVAMISGRDLADVRSMVDLDDIVYAGSHGFDIVFPGGRREQRGQEFLPALDEAEQQLNELIERVEGAWVERKGFAIAVHYRQASEDQVEAVEGIVDRVASRHPELRKTGGKKIFELRPSMRWDKGRALLLLLDVLGLSGADVVCVYIGDDETDEDAFRAIGSGGFGVVVGTDDRPTAARYALRDHDDVRQLLELFTTLASGGHP